ncbi:MAG: NADH-quinone oxidoreductase subunit J [Actinomycetota bacterium]|nr:NADH-quinone oxidoreductase subunit J [Actinomycetota bacterium]
MTFDTATAVQAALAIAALLGASTVVFAKDVTRMAAGLGLFLLCVAGWFAYLSASFLAVAQVFVYVGGVLILFIFAIMLLHREDQEKPGLTSRHDIGSVSVALAVFVLTFMPLIGVASAVGPVRDTGAMPDLAAILTGPMLPQFEAVGVLLLAALVAVVVVMGGERE